MNREKGNRALSTLPVAPLKSAHIKTTFTRTQFTHEARNCTKIVTRVSKTLLAGNTWKNTRLTLRQASEPEGVNPLYNGKYCMPLSVFHALVFGLALCLGASLT